MDTVHWSKNDIDKCARLQIRILMNNNWEERANFEHKFDTKDLKFYWIHHELKNGHEQFSPTKYIPIASNFRIQWADVDMDRIDSDQVIISNTYSKRVLSTISHSLFLSTREKNLLSFENDWRFYWFSVNVDKISFTYDLFVVQLLSISFDLIIFTFFTSLCAHFVCFLKFRKVSEIMEFTTFLPFCIIFASIHNSVQMLDISSNKKKCLNFSFEC